VQVDSVLLTQLADTFGHGLQWQNSSGGAVGYIYMESGAFANMFWGSPGGHKFACSSDWSNPVATLLATGCTFKGTTTNDDAATGFIGEYLEANANPNTAIGSGTANGVSFVVPAGDWEIGGHMHVSSGAAYIGIDVILTTTSAFRDKTIGNYQTALTGGENDVWVNFPPVRRKLPSSTTYFLVGYSASAITIKESRLWARRMR
jgi:hypothetical protein